MNIYTLGNKTPSGRWKFSDVSLEVHQILKIPRYGAKPFPQQKHPFFLASRSHLAGYRPAPGEPPWPPNSARVARARSSKCPEKCGAPAESARGSPLKNYLRIWENRRLNPSKRQVNPSDWESKQSIDNLRNEPFANMRGCPATSTLFKANDIACGKSLAASSQMGIG